MSQFINITDNDKILTTDKVTKGFFTGDKGTLKGSDFTTSSLSTTQKAYYYNVQHSSEDQFSVTFGHSGGSGSSDVTSTTFGKTQAIYKQFQTMLQDYDDADKPFIINSATASGI